MALIGNQTGETGSYRVMGGTSSKGILITMPEAGTAVSIFANIGASDAGYTWQCGIRDTSGNLISGGSSTPRTGISGGHAWQEFTGLSAALSASGQYIIDIACSNSVADGISYAASDTYDGRTSTSNAAVNPLADPVTYGTDSTRDYQIYLNYTPGGGGSAIAAISHYYNSLRS